MREGQREERRQHEIRMAMAILMVNMKRDQNMNAGQISQHPHQTSYYWNMTFEIYYTNDLLNHISVD